MTQRDGPLRSYGRIKSRSLKPRQAALLETLLPRLALPEAGALDIEALFPPRKREQALPPALGRRDGEGGAGASPETSPADAPATDPAAPGGGGVVIEIGFGGGEHLVAHAVAAPAARFIGVEPFVNGVASCLRHIEEAGAGNVRLHAGDARDVVARLPEASVALAYILFPDPWPKTRHWKRRLVQPDFVAARARVLAPGGGARGAPHRAHYAAWTLQCFTRSASFTWTAECAADWRAPWPGHVTTRYEQKRLGDCAPIWLRFTRAADER
jgi:tRNA (guanine-N7-)-methyltransferase